MEAELKHRWLGAGILALLVAVIIPWMLSRTHFPSKVVAMNAVPVIQQEVRMNPLKPVLVKATKSHADAHVKRIEVKKMARSKVRPKKPAPHKRITQTQAKPIKHSMSGWLVQVGSFTEHKGVNRMLAQLKENGFNAFNRTARQNNKTYYRVLVGPSKSKLVAQRVARRLKSKHQINGFVVHQ